MCQPQIGRTILWSIAVSFLWAGAVRAIQAAAPSADIAAGVNLLPAPRTDEEVKARVEQLRACYRPYLRSLPKPLGARARVELRGPWRSKFELAKATSGARPPAPDWWRADFDDSVWEKATVPQWRYGMENAQERTPLSCILWFRTAFEAHPPKPGRRVFLVFAGVEWEAEVWLNGAFLGRHQVYYEPFRFDVTTLLQKKNTLAVRVTAGPRFGEPVFEWPVLPDVPAAQQCYVRDFAKSVPGHRIGMLYAGSGFGIHREVFLETTGAVCAAEVFARGNPRLGEARVVVETDSKRYEVEEVHQMQSTRRPFLTISWLSMVLAWLSGHNAAVSFGAEKPNIIFILADDLGYGDLGCYGQWKIQTPCLDRMAAEGIRFTDCYAGSTVCAPSRCVLMTGYHTGHSRIRGNARVPLRPEDRTVAEILKQVGYSTGIVGKWGLGEAGTTGIPNRKGFDYWFGYLNQSPRNS